MLCFADKRVQIFTVEGPSGQSDQRYLYEYGIMRLALEKTVDEYGPYLIEKRPNLTHTRVLKALEENTYENYFRSFSFDKTLETERKLTFVPIPIYQGAVGFRTCFMSKGLADEFASAASLDSLKRYSHAIGTGWFDGLILKANGFTVHEFANYDSLFKLVAINRIDVFCRAASEVKDEYEIFGDLQGFHYDRSTMLYYPFPIFLWSNSQNEKAIERVTAGMRRSFNDGSFHSLWERIVGPNARFANIKNRKLFVLENPLLEGLSLSFEKYYHPMFIDALEKGRSTTNFSQ